MDLNSALYDCRVSHIRKSPKAHSFGYNVFMCWLDLDELSQLDSSLKYFSYNSRNLFAFYDKDHFKRPDGKEDGALVRERCEAYLDSIKIPRPSRIMLLTNLRVLGYVFNPVSFYYCYDDKNNCTDIIAEVSNTFGEMKLFHIPTGGDQVVHQTEDKYFYVSPFTDLDDTFHFTFRVPGEKYFTGINVSKKGEVYFYSTLNGTRYRLTDGALLKRFFTIPLVTIKVIAGIHWQAFRIWLKGMAYHKKKDHPELQRGIINRTSQD